MKKSWILIGILLIAALGGGTWWYASRPVPQAAVPPPSLPDARKFDAAMLGPSSGSTADQGGPVEGGVATSQNYVLISSPTNAPKHVDPFAPMITLPSATRLDVPFVPSATSSHEAALLMADGYYRGISGKLTDEIAARAMDQLQKAEESVTSTPLSLAAQDISNLFIHVMQVQDIVVAPLDSVDQIHRSLAAGFPVIVPVSGLARNPAYHAIIVTGYENNSMIVNDPTLADGMNMLVSENDLVSAAHDWNGGDTAHGKPVVLVEIPRL